MPAIRPIRLSALNALDPLHQEIERGEHHDRQADVDHVGLLAAGLAALPESYRRDRAWYGACLAHACARAGDADRAESVALRFTCDIVAVNSYARGELREAARTLDGKGARQGKAIRDFLAAQER